MALLGDPRMHCWSRVERALTVDAVAYVPVVFGTSTTVVSDRVAEYSFDVSVGLPSLARLAIRS